MNKDLKELGLPFPEKDIEWRIGRSGKGNNGPWATCLAYLNARAVMDRLDDVVGPGKWKDRYWKEGNAVMCALAIKVDNEWVEKIDGSEETDIEAVKGGLSGAFKRAAVKWGIGRYLYSLEEGYAKIVQKGTPGALYAKTKDGEAFHWLPPTMPEWAIPAKHQTAVSAKTIQPAAPQGSMGSQFRK